MLLKRSEISQIDRSAKFFDLLEKEAYLSTANIIGGSCAKAVPPAARTQFKNIGFQRTTQTLFTIKECIITIIHYLLNQRCH